MEATTDEQKFGTGRKVGSITGVVLVQRVRFYPFTLWSSGGTETILSYNHIPPFDIPALLQEWRERFAAAVQVTVGKDATSFGTTMANLADSAKLAAFLDTMTWAVQRMRKSQE